MPKSELLENLFNQIRKGELHCPFSSCTSSFFTSFELADHLKKDCDFGFYHGKLPCTHCCVVLKAEDLKVHWRIFHKPVIKSLFSLTHCKSVECPNYLCDEVFSPSFQECKRYVKHSIICRPLYICKVCKIEYLTETALLKHKCVGTIKRILWESISKKEIDIERNISDRPKLSITEEKDLLEKWQQKIKLGNFLCPVPSCNKEFFVPNYYIKHLKKENKFDNIFQKIDAIECPFCSSPVKLFIFHRHMQNNHRDITQTLNQLKDGGRLCCPNALCATKSNFTSKTGTEYLKHAIKCRPLYICNICHATLKTKKFYENHIKNCIEDSPLKNPTKMIKKVSALRTIQQDLLTENNISSKKTKTLQTEMAASNQKKMFPPFINSSNISNEQINSNQDDKITILVPLIKTEAIDDTFTNKPVDKEQFVDLSMPIVVLTDIYGKHRRPNTPTSNFKVKDNFYHLRNKKRKFLSKSS